MFRIYNEKEAFYLYYISIKIIKKVFYIYLNTDTRSIDNLDVLLVPQKFSLLDF